MRPGGANSVANTRDSDRVCKKPERWQTKYTLERILNLRCMFL